ncbi:MAG: hypothetical protein GY716_07810 [bacterium]|nr:hypothetical protein [bacterium]
MLRKIALSLVVLSLLPGLAAAAPRYAYVEAGYVDFDPDGGSSDDGVFGGISLGLPGPFYATGEYLELEDVELWNVGAGWFGFLGNQADLVAEIKWLDLDFDDGTVVSGGARWDILRWLQVKGLINWTDLDDAGSDTTFEAEGLVSILKGKLGIGANVEVGENDTLKVFARYTFGM